MDRGYISKSLPIPSVLPKHPQISSSISYFYISRPLSAAYLHVAQVLGSNPEYTVISIGGQLLLPSLNAVGHVAENMIRSFNYNYAFIGVGSIDEQGYLYYYNMMESGTFTAIIESAQHVVVVADSTKFEKKPSSSYVSPVNLNR